MNTQDKEIEARLLAIVESADDAIISNKFDGIITSWNHAAENIFKYSAGEAINNHISIIVPEEFYEEQERIISQIRNGERIKHYETVRKTKDGNKIDIALTVSPLKASDTDVTGMSIIARDISLQKLVNEKQSVLSAIVNSSDDAIISKTLEGIILSWNPAAQKMFGYSEKEAIGKNISMIIPPERLQEEQMILEN